MRLHLAAIAVALAGFGLPASSVCAQERASYTFYRNGVPVGRHVIEITGHGSRRDVTLSTQIAVQLADRITLFRYAHQGKETWDGERLIAMETRTDENGKTFRVIVNSSPSGLAVRATVPDVEQASTGDRMLTFQSGNSEKLVEQVVPINVLPTSWSNARVLQQNRLLNSQTGSVGSITVQELGTEVVQTGLGQIPASRYRITGMVPQDIWYDARGRWIKSAFRGRDGSAVEVIHDR